MTIYILKSKVKQNTAIYMPAYNVAAGVFHTADQDCDNASCGPRFDNYFHEPTALWQDEKR